MTAKTFMTLVSNQDSPGIATRCQFNIARSKDKEMKVCHFLYNYINIIQIYSGITSGRVLDGERLYTKILEVNLLFYLHLPTDCFMDISLQSTEQ